jgi:hypothetical protein
MKKLKRREGKEEYNKKKRSKNYRKKEKPKKLGRMVAPVHNFDPKIKNRVGKNPGFKKKNQPSCIE